MPDREYTIERLKKALSTVMHWCRTNDLNDPISEMERAMEDAIALLKKQETVEPKWVEFEDGLTGQKYEVASCGFCGTVLSGDEWYCPQCGKEVKWDDAE